MKPVCQQILIKFRMDLERQNKQRDSKNAEHPN